MYLSRSALASAYIPSASMCRGQYHVIPQCRYISSARISFSYKVIAPILLATAVISFIERRLWSAA